MSNTPRLGLPFLSAGQAQKELFHNEALQTLDIMVGGTVEELPRISPPVEPSLGSCYIVATTATGGWAGKHEFVAAYTNAGWRFVPPRAGMVFYIRSTGTWAVYHESGWEIGIVRGSAVSVGGKQVVDSRLAGIASTSGGANADTEARATIDQILAAMRQHGLIEP